MNDRSVTVQETQTVPAATHRSTYVFLGICLGVFGMHNFYAQRWRNGLIQLALTITGMYLSLLVVGLFLIVSVYGWALLELFSVTKNGEDVPMI